MQFLRFVTAPLALIVTCLIVIAARHLVVLSEPVETWKYLCTMYNEFTIDILNRYGELPSVFITHEANFAEEPTGLYRNVKKEGILIYEQ